jgi:hypothetical protein
MEGHRSDWRTLSHVFDVDLSAHDDMNECRTKLRAPYGVLVQLLGAPAKDIPEKCSTLWSFRAHDDGAVVWLQDWQDEDDRSFQLNEFRGLPSYDWDVYAPSDEVAKRFCDWLSKRVIAKASEAKTLGPEARAALNALLAQGVPISEAMKRVPLTSPADAATRFKWPIS